MLPIRHLDNLGQLLAKGVICYRWLPAVWKADLSDKKRMSSKMCLCQYFCMDASPGRKQKKKKLDCNYTRMSRAILNKSWKQCPTKQQMYDHLPSISKNIQLRRTSHAGHCSRIKDELLSDILLCTPTHRRDNVGTQQKLICANTGRSLEDLPGEMNDGDGWREKIRKIPALSVTW